MMCFAALWLAVAGCGTIPVPIDRARVSPLPAELVAYYQYRPVPLETVIDSVEECSGYRIKRLHLVSPKSSDFRPIRIDWYEPQRRDRHPVILMSPILAGNDLYVREFARFFAARDLNTMIVYRPKEVFSADRELKEIETHLHESVIQLRRTLDWLETRESVDPNRVGCFGISLGAILTTIFTAVEPRVKASVLGMPAGDVAEIIIASQDKAIRKRRRAYLERHRISEEEALRELKGVIVSEPMRFAPAIDPSRMLIIAGLFDRVLGFKRSLALWRAMGRPKLILLPTGHYTAYFATPYLKLVTYSFLRRHL